MHKFFLFAVFFLLFLSTEILAQSMYRFRFEEPWSFSLQAGPSQYFGDLYALWQYSEGIQPDYNGAMSARYTFGTNLKARVDLTYYQISGQDVKADPRSGRIPRDLNFRSRNWEAAFLVEYYYKPVKVYNITREFINPYVFFGVGASTSNPRTLYREEWVDLRPLRTENELYANRVMVFPMGLGMKYKVNVYMDFFIEGNYRFTLSDYMDDISTFNISGYYEELIADYVSGENPDRLRLSVRQPRYLLPNGEPNVELIRNSRGAPRRGSGDPRLDEPEARYDGYFTLNFGAEIYFSQDIWDNWIFRYRGRGFRFW
ncbi:hypothetical protein [Cyclobacterium sp.]|uniref:hypothetical protein n=1 Tax=Cyclobacterium sp. TaxID=1966343 RepID=UPI0019BAC018|nr:hypothetical protein [Cyclobacterium sp.]MBD3627706.1 hypothetical protein [Cyclobacterium sp.]